MAISGIMVVKGSPRHIEASLSSLQQLVDEVIIADIGMDKGLSEKLSKNTKLRILPLPPVPYVELIREKLKGQAAHPYVFFLDPDEILSPSLIQMLKTNYEKFDYVSIPRKNIIFGKWIKNSRWWPDYQIRLFRKNAVIWPAQIHHQPTVTGKELKLENTQENAIEHYNYESIDEYIEKATRYAKAEAKEKIDAGAPFTLSTVIKNALSEYISRFFAEEGYKDGIHGFMLAFLQMFYSFLVYFYYWEMKKRPEVEEKELVSLPETFFKQGVKETHYWMIEKKLKNNSLVEKIKNKLL